MLGHRDVPLRGFPGENDSNCMLTHTRNSEIMLASIKQQTDQNIQSLRFPQSETGSGKEGLQGRFPCGHLPSPHQCPPSPSTHSALGIRNSHNSLSTQNTLLCDSFRAYSLCQQRASPGCPCHLGGPTGHRSLLAPSEFPTHQFLCDATTARAS